MKTSVTFLIAMVCAYASPVANIDADKPEGDRDVKEPPAHIKESISDTIMFHVYYTAEEELVNEHGSSRSVPYNNVGINIGDGYNIDLHSFSAPVAGLYMFTVDGFSGSKGPGCIELLKNDVWVDGGYASAHHSTMSMTTGMYLQQGDTVHVIMCSWITSYMEQYSKNSFTGFLVARE